jgi:hypothetical protein
MEIKDLVSFYIDDTSNLLEVSFRTIDDDEDQVRQDTISLNEITEFGYDFLSNNINESDEDYDDIDDLYEGINYIEDDDIISFLNEYYMINPKKLPKPELF